MWKLKRRNLSRSFFFREWCIPQTSVISSLVGIWWPCVCKTAVMRRSLKVKLPDLYRANPGYACLVKMRIFLWALNLFSLSRRSEFLSGDSRDHHLRKHSWNLWDRNSNIWTRIKVYFWAESRSDVQRFAVGWALHLNLPDSFTFLVSNVAVSFLSLLFLSMLSTALFNWWRFILLILLYSTHTHLHLPSSFKVIK